MSSWKVYFLCKEQILPLVFKYPILIIWFLESSEYFLYYITVDLRTSLQIVNVNSHWLKLVVSSGNYISSGFTLVKIAKLQYWFFIKSTMILIEFQSNNRISFFDIYLFIDIINRSFYRIVLNYPIILKISYITYDIPIENLWKWKNIIVWNIYSRVYIISLPNSVGERFCLVASHRHRMISAIIESTKTYPLWYMICHLYYL